MKKITVCFLTFIIVTGIVLYDFAAITIEYIIKLKSPIDLLHEWEAIIYSSIGLAKAMIKHDMDYSLVEKELMATIDKLEKEVGKKNGVR